MNAEERDDQATPPSGYQVPEESDQTVAEPGDQPTEAEGTTTTWTRGEDGQPEEVSEPSDQAAVTYEPPAGGQDDDEYQWHTAKTTRSETAETDAVEFIDVKKAFGRNTVLNGLNLGIP